MKLFTNIKLHQIKKSKPSLASVAKKVGQVGLFIVLLCAVSLQSSAQCDFSTATVNVLAGTCFANAELEVSIGTVGVPDCSIYLAIITDASGNDIPLGLNPDGSPITFLDLQAGDYTLRFSNGNASQDVQYASNPITVTSSYVPMVLSSSGASTTCSVGADFYTLDAELTLNVDSGGTGDFIYEVTSSLGTMTFGPTSDRSHVFTGLPDGEDLSFNVTDLVGGQTGCAVTESQTRNIPHNSENSNGFSFSMNSIRDCSASATSCNDRIVTEITLRGGNNRVTQTYVLDNNTITMEINGNGILLTPPADLTLTSLFSNQRIRITGFPAMTTGDSYEVIVTTECNVFTYAGVVPAHEGPKVTTLLESNSDIVACIGITNETYFIRNKNIRGFCPGSTQVIEQETSPGVWTEVYNGLIASPITVPSAGTYRVTYTDAGTGCTFVEVNTVSITAPTYYNAFDDDIDLGNSASFLDGTGGFYIAVDQNESNGSYIVEYPLTVSISPVPYIANTTFIANGPYGLDDSFTTTWPFVYMVNNYQDKGRTGDIRNLPPGDYEITVTDNCGTQKVIPYTIDILTIWGVPEITIIPGCANSNSIEFDIHLEDRNNVAHRGHAARLYLDDGTGNPTGPVLQELIESRDDITSFVATFNNLPANDYVVVLEAISSQYKTFEDVDPYPEAINRFYNYPVTVAPYANNTVENVVSYCSLTDQNSGIISTQITGGTTIFPVTYELYATAAPTTVLQTATITDDTVLGNVFNNVPSGEYFVRVINQCYTVDTNVSVQTSNLVPPIVITNNQVFCPGNNSLTLEVTDPNELFDITWTSDLGDDFGLNNNPVTVAVPGVGGTTIVYTATYVLKPSICPVNGGPETEDVTVTIIEDPDNTLAVSDIGDVCANPSPYNVTISNTQTDYTYEIVDNAGASFSPAITGVGTGGDLVLTIPDTDVPLTGVTTQYTVNVYGTLNTGCATTLLDPINISNTQPVVDLALTGSQVCSNLDGTITITSSEVGVTYEVKLAGSSLSPAVTAVGTGADLVLTIPAAQMIAGVTTYTIDATGPNCTVTLDNTVDVEEFTGIDTDSDGIIDDCDLDDDNDGILDTVECPPSSPSTNVALSGTASQSSTSSGGIASRAIDGNTNGNYSGANSTTHTASQTDPSWNVDLGAVFNISEVNVFNRTDCCSNRLDNFILEILDASNTVVYTYNHAGSVSGSTSIPIPSIDGQTVQVSLSGGGRILSLAEVQVMGTSNIQSDTDGDGIDNCLDLDSDGDGCNDVDEAYANIASPDTDNDGIADDGTNTPPTVANGGVDANGLVIAAAYSAPAVGTSTANTFQEAIQLNIDTAPVDDPQCSGTAASLTGVVTAETADSYTAGSPEYTNIDNDAAVGIKYQWQLAGVDLADDAIYSGTDAATLNISDNTGLDGGVYTLVVTHDDMVCPEKRDVTLTIIGPDKTLAVSDIGDACANPSPFNAVISSTQTDYTYELVDDTGASFVPAITSIGTGGDLILTIPDDEMPPHGVTAVYGIKVYSTLNTECGAILLDGVEVTGCVLPVELVSFNVSNQDSHVKLAWTTASEINNDRFDIEHSVDGQHFELIGSVAGQGTTSEQMDYTFMHLTPSTGNNYYRLKQVDYDGKLDYSPIRSIRFNGESDTNAFTIYPNPTHDVISIVNTQNLSGHRVMLRDVTGRLIRTQPYISGMVIDLSDRQAGLYLIQVMDALGQPVYTEKMIKH